MRLMLVFIVGAVLFSGSGHAGDRNKNGAIAHFREKTLTIHAIGQFAGAQQVFHTRVYLALRDAFIGNGWWSCTYVEPGNPRECKATYELPEGQIQIQGIIHNPSRYTLMIVAGTGSYEGQFGTVQFATIADNQRILTFYFEGPH
jgi:hypothetical protein